MIFWPKFKAFFRPKLGDLPKKKKRSSPKLRLLFRPISQIQTFEGGLFLNGGGYFPFFTENRPQKHKKHAILHTSQANGGGLEAPPPPPGYATGYFKRHINLINENFIHRDILYNETLIYVRVKKTPALHKTGLFKLFCLVYP